MIKMDEDIKEKSLQLLERASGITDKMEFHFDELMELIRKFNSVLHPGALKEPYRGTKVRVPYFIRHTLLPRGSSFEDFKLYGIEYKRNWIRKVSRKHFKDE
jgi:hypothetical protein